MSYTDVLQYTQLKNNLTTQDDLTKYNLNLIQTPPSNMKNTDYYDNILSNTTMKRACCMNSKYASTLTNPNSYPVTVRIPIPKDYVVDDNAPSNLVDTWKKFGYIDKTIYVPSSVCSNIKDPFGNATYTNTDGNSCSDFMQLYCSNVRKFYDDELATLGGEFDEFEFPKYKPECACYSKVPDYIKKTSPSSPRSCYMVDCMGDGTGIENYVDPSSRVPCQSNFCSSAINVGNIEASSGGLINFTPSIELKCSSEISKIKQNQTLNNTTNDTTNNNSSTTIPTITETQPSATASSPATTASSPSATASSPSATTASSPSATTATASSPSATTASSPSATTASSPSASSPSATTASSPSASSPSATTASPATTTASPSPTSAADPYAQYLSYLTPQPPSVTNNTTITQSSSIPWTTIIIVSIIIIIIIIIICIYFMMNNDN
jgi:hypothetical protein